MPLDFPNSPTVGTTYTGPSGVVWTYDGAKWASGASTTAFAPIGSPAFTGDPTAPTPAYGDNDTSIATTAFVAAAVAPAFNASGRNLIHNALFNVAQRGAGPFTGNGVYSADRWLLNSDTDAMSVVLYAAVDGDRATLGDESMRTILGNIFTGSAAATAFNAVYHRMEDVRRFAGKTVTVSFWAKQNAGPATKVGVSIDQVFGSGGSPSAYVPGAGQAVTISATWQRYTLSFAVPSVAGKTFGTTVGTDWAQVGFWFSSGATNATRAGNIGVQSGNIALWGVQLEIGSTATPLEKPDPRYDLANCQRFASIFPVLVPALATPSNIVFPVTMRGNPLVTGGGAGFTQANLSPSAATISQTAAANQTLTFSADL